MAEHERGAGSRRQAQPVGSQRNRPGSRWPDLCIVPDAVTLLRAAADVVRCPEVGVAIVEAWGAPRALDLTASRRLATLAAASGVTTLMLRAEAEPVPSAAQTRWAVRAGVSTPLEAGAPGHPALAVELLRQRGRPGVGSWRVEWDREQAVLCERRTGDAPPSGAVVSFPAGRATEAGFAPFRRAG